MTRRSFNIILAFLTALLLVIGTAACGGGDHEHGEDTHTHSEEEAHEHGEATHTHEAMAADTAGTYVDTTGAFFDDDPEAHQDDEEVGHEHGEDTHTHDGEEHEHQ